MTATARAETKKVVAELLAQDPTPEDVNDLRNFELIHDEFLNNVDAGKAGIAWEKIEPLPAELSVAYASLPAPASRDEVVRMLQKTVVVKINGGLGTTMGCSGPKSVIEVQAGKTFLDLIILQMKKLHALYGVVVPLVLMNSFNTDHEPKEYIKKYTGDADVRILTFLQHKSPRIDGETYVPIPHDLHGPNAEWHPPGHGDFLGSFVDSDAFRELKAEGRETIFLANVDNLGAQLDPTLLHHFVTSGLEFALELTPKTLSDVKGGTLIRYENRLKLLEIAQVPRDHVEEFQDIKKFTVFNTNNVWMSLPAVERVVTEKTLMPKMDIIVNRKTYNGRPVIQLEIAVGCAIAAFDRTAAYVVPRTRFLPVKTCNDLFLIQSDRCEKSPSGDVVMKGEQPLVDLGKAFTLVADYNARCPCVPDIAELHSLHVTGDVAFGPGVVLKGDVVIRNETGAQVTVADRTVSGELTF